MRYIPFNEGWTFKQLGDSHEFNTARTAVTLPHDPVIGMKRQPDQMNGTKKAFFPNGAWEYVKAFDTPTHWAGKKVYLEFQGVQNHGMVYVNGNFAGGCAYGYSEFLVPIHEYLRFGEKNAIQVLCKTEDDSRWYTGGGIYRDVGLLVGLEQHIVPNGVKITTLSANAQTAQLAAKITLAQSERTVISLTVCKDEQQVCQVEANCEGSCELTLEISRPQLWSDEAPHLYTWYLRAGEDEGTGRFGIRTFSASPRTGLLVNGMEVKLRGACIHHDSGILGAATYRDAEFRRVRLLKEAGFNAIRMAHHPASRHLLDACDELGMYVMDEAFDVWQLPKSSGDHAQDFSHNWEADIRAMVDKDYNHPSVILYSIGNEISDLASAVGVKTAETLSRFVKTLDASRYTTVAINGLLLLMRKMEVQSQLTGAVEEKKQDVNAAMSSLDDVMLRINNAPSMDAAIQGGCDAVDIAGYNYMHNRYAPDLEKYPDRLIVGSETYAKYIVPMWRHIEKHHNVIGDFTWTGWDYLGETGIGNVSYEPRDYHGGFYGVYPCITANCGDLDITGFRTPQSYFREIAYGLRKAPYMAVHNPAMAGKTEYLSTWGWGDVCASWSYPGFEGTEVTVDVYGRGQVELFLNGRSLGVKDCGEECKCSFTVAYEPGVLTAVSDGGSFCLKSAGEDVRLCVRAENERIRAGQLGFLQIELTDGQGIVHWGKDREISLHIEGGKLLGFGSGAPMTEESYTDHVHTTYRGRAQAVIMAEQGGSLTLRAKAEGLNDVILQLEVQK